MKGSIAIAFAALLACACAPAQDRQPEYLPAKPPVAGMDQPMCFATATAADGSRLQLRLSPTRAAKWIRVAGMQRTGEGDGAWEPDGDNVSLETYYASSGMPALPEAMAKQADGSLVAEGIGTFASAECWPLVAMAYDLPMATLQIPEGMEVTGREDTRDFGTGKPGMYVTIESPDEDGFLALIGFIYAEAGAPPMDAREEAVRTGNPFDDSLTADAATEQSIGGQPGAKFDGTMRALGVSHRMVGYAIDFHGCRMNVQLQGGEANQDAIDRIAAAVESMQWKESAQCAAPPEA
jgi:hypothetical protein